MSGPDGGLRRVFAEHLRRGWHWVSVETGGTGRGVPDAEYCAPGGVTGWLECKATDGWVVGLRPEQVGWLERRAAVGGRATVAVRQRGGGGPRAPTRDALWLLEGAAAATLRAGGLRPLADAAADLEGPLLANVGEGSPRLLLGYWDGGPALWDWDAVAAVLRR